MTEQEQIALFKRVQKRFRKWSERKCSGYVHGIVDEGHRVGPLPCAVNNPSDAYYVAYLHGFIDARGSDVVSEDWYRANFSILPNTYEPDYRWWDK